MFSRIRSHITYANVAVTFAVVFAMSGAAYAAKHYVITSTKQISPKALAELKKKDAGAQGATGAHGKDGAVGSQGSQGLRGDTGSAGEKGAVGPQGATGPTGQTGVKGTTGAAGPTGPTGTTGSPWTVGNKLPTGATETGAWGVFKSKENGTEVGPSLSFTLRVEDGSKKAPQGEFHYAGSTSANCKGSASAPTAEPGFLCVYDAYAEKPLSGATEGTIAFNGFENGEEEFGGGGGGVGKEGTIMKIETVNIGSALLPTAVAEGTWAVTGP